MKWDRIFRAGIHTSSDGRTRKWTREDLDTLVANTKTENEVPIVIIHPKKQDNAFKFGRIEKIKRDGDDLLALYSDIPQVLEAAVNEGLKLGKSISVDPDKMEICHIGLLGANQPPAVEGLGAFSFSKEEPLTYTMKQEEKVDKDKIIQELQDKIRELEGNEVTKELEAKIEELKKALDDEKKDHQKTKEEFSKFKKEQDENVLKKRVDALAESGRIRPAEKEKILGFAKALPNKENTMEFCAGDGKKESVTPRENYLRDLEAGPANKGGLLDEFAKQEKAGRGDENADWTKDINNYA